MRCIRIRRRSTNVRCNPKRRISRSFFVIGLLAKLIGLVASDVEGKRVAGEQRVAQHRAMGLLLILAVTLGLLGLPVAVWLDLRQLSERLLRT